MDEFSKSLLCAIALTSIFAIIQTFPLTKDKATDEDYWTMSFLLWALVACSLILVLYLFITK